MQCFVDGPLQKLSLITITKAIAVTVALLTSSWLWMSVLLLALHSLSLINPQALCDCDNAIYPGSSALRPVRLSRSAVCTVQWAPVALPCWPSPPWQPGQPPLTCDLSRGLGMRREKNGSCLNLAIRICRRQGRALQPLEETHIFGYCYSTTSSASGETSAECDGLCNWTCDVWWRSKWGT